MRAKIVQYYYKIVLKLLTALNYTIGVLNRRLITWLIYCLAIAFFYPLVIIRHLTTNNPLNNVLCFIYALLLLTVFALLRIYNAIVKNTEYLMKLKTVMDTFNKNSLSISNIYRSASNSMNGKMEGFGKVVNEFSNLITALINALKK